MGTPRKPGCRCHNCDTGERKPGEYDMPTRATVSATAEAYIRRLKGYGAKSWKDDKISDLLCIWSDIEEGCWR